ncbi:MAG TPA: universal stress protein [Burkholderiaceae bacterium]|nr:universal stress protein [Burkholderiaceae bacterium]
MSSLTNIVVATDLSASSRDACDRAALLARTHGAELTLMHALAASALDELRRAGDAADAQAIEDDARSRLHALATELQRRYGARVAEHLAAGHPLGEIASLAEQLDAELLVTGTRGSGFTRGVVLGSMAERVARYARRPVLMVRQAVHGPYRRVLVPVDFSPWSLESVRVADGIAPDATLVLMHAVEVPFERRRRRAGVAEQSITRQRARARDAAQRQLDALAAQTGLAAERLLQSTPEGDDPWMLIAQQEQEHDCDLIVMGRQGRHAIGELMLGSTTRMVLAECRADVLVSVRRAAEP